MGFSSRIAVLRRSIYLVALGVLALVSFLGAGTVRRTFVFFTNEGLPLVEERALPLYDDLEDSIRAYMDDLLLGPLSPDTAFFFPEGARLRSFFYRSNRLYADYNRTAYFADFDWQILAEELSRNFPMIREMYFFIDGIEIFTKT
jgi:hypothetical protein